MSKFKKFFYLAYVIYFLIGLYVAIYYEDLVLRWDWDFIEGWVSLLKFVLKLGGIGIILFIIELIVENIHIASLKGKISALEKEKLELKAKLYDKGESESIEVSTPEDNSGAATEEKESEAK